MSRVLVTFLSIFLVLTAHDVHAYPNLSLGAGYTSDCLTHYSIRDDGSVNQRCRKGPRAEALIDLFGGEASASSSENDDDGFSSWMRNVNPFDALRGSGGDFFAVLGAILIVILVMYVTYGLVMGIAALFAAETSFGFYYAEDYFPGAATNDAGEKLPGSIRRYGVQLSFFPLADFSFRLHMGAGPASFVDRAADDEQTYRDGFSSKIGLGFAPHPGVSGFYATWETEYLTIYARTFKDLAKNALPTKEPEYRATSTGLIGYTFAF